MRNTKKTTKKYKKNMKRKNRSTKRKMIIKRNKAKQSRRTRKKIGGLKNGHVCESEGCVFHPSIISNNPNRVTKLYNNEKIYNKELESYSLFTSVDSNYHYHCEIFSNGLITSDELKNKFEIFPRHLKMDKSYFYIDMEYAGETIGNISESDVTKGFKLSFLQFLINVLSLRNNEGKYLVHGDPHGGNICYKVYNSNDRNEYIIKYIDITNLIFVDPDKIIELKTEVTYQFSSLIGNLRHIFGFSNVIVDELMPLVMSLPGRKYDEIVNTIIKILEKNYEIINKEEDSGQISPISIRQIDESSPPPNKKTRSIQIPPMLPMGKMRALSIDEDDDFDENNNENEKPSNTIFGFSPKKLF